MVVGLTGGIGSGKSTIAKMFDKFGNIAIYHADAEAKKLMITSDVIVQKIVANFGEESYNSKGLNRNYIASIVFKNEEKLRQLNQIVHPEVKKHFKNFIENHRNKDYILYENAILFESKSSSKCDFIISVFVDVETRIQRTINRDKTSREEVLHRIKNQWLETKKTLQSNYIIYNYDLKIAERQVNNIHNILTKKASLIL